MDKNRKVAIIDDDVNLTAALENILTDIGYQVATHNTVQFVNFLKQEQPDVVLLDVWFDEDELGTKLAQAFHQHDQLRKVPIILMSSDNEVPLYAERVNADAYLEKPFEMSDLFMLLEHVSKASNGLQ